MIHLKLRGTKRSFSIIMNLRGPEERFVAGPRVSPVSAAIGPHTKLGVSSTQIQNTVVQMHNRCGTKWPFRIVKNLRGPEERLVAGPRVSPVSAAMGIESLCRILSADFPSPARGGKACQSSCKHDHFTSMREIGQHVRALARNHQEGWKLQGHVSSATTNYLTKTPNNYFWKNNNFWRRLALTAFAGFRVLLGR